MLLIAGGLFDILNAVLRTVAGTLSITRSHAGY